VASRFKRPDLRVIVRQNPILGQAGMVYRKGFPPVTAIDRAADAAVAASDNGLLADKATTASVSRFAMVRNRFHGVGRARHRLLLIRKMRPGTVHHASSPRDDEPHNLAVDRWFPVAFTIDPPELSDVPFAANAMDYLFRIIFWNYFC
jgi:hypothetical protein